MEQINNIRRAQMGDQLLVDPRIDSPDIEIRPITEQKPVREIQTVAVEPTKDEPKEEHKCEVGFQDAMKQHFLPVLGMLFGAMLLGFLLGRR